MAYIKTEEQQMKNEETTMKQAFAELKHIMKMQAKEYLTIDEAAELYDVKTDTLKKMVKNCSLHAYKCTNGKICVRKGDLHYAVFGEPLGFEGLAQLKF